MHCSVLSHSVVSDLLLPHGLKPTRLLSPWGFSRQEYHSGLPCRPPGGRSWSGYPLQYSFLENPMNKGVWQAIHSLWGLKDSDTTE